MNVVMMTSLPAADCSTFLLLRRKKLDRQGRRYLRYNVIIIIIIIIIIIK